jgi:hypothetical protein
MQECNPPRNSWLQTHQNDETRGGAGKGLAPDLEFEHRIDRFAHTSKTHNEWFRLPRLFSAAAAESVCCGSGAGSKPALRRSLRR